MRSKTFATIVGVLCIGLAGTCVWLGIRFWSVYQLRRAFPKAVNLYNNGEFEAALPHLDRAIGHYPTRVEPYRLAATICMKLDQPGRARGYYEGMLDYAKGANLAEAHLRLGALTLDADRADKAALGDAVAHLEAARDAFKELKDLPRLARALLLLAAAYTRTDDLKSAERCFEQAAALPKSARRGGITPVLLVSQLANKLRAGEPGDLVAAWNTYKRSVSRGAIPARPKVRAAIGLALAFHAADPSLSSSIRRVCLQAMQRIPQQERDRHAFLLHMLTAYGWERLDDMQKALLAARSAYKLKRTSAPARRVLANALFAVAAGARTDAQRQQLLAEAVKLYHDLLVSGTLNDTEQQQLTLALATVEWNRGREDEARKLLRRIDRVQSPLIERMKATTALQKGDYPALIAHLRRVADIEKGQPDVAALLKRLSTPPDIYNFHVNQLNRYDARPILTVSFAPRAIPVPIASDKVAMSLDGKLIKPLVARGECFFRPDKELPAGDHRIEVAVADSLGLKASKSFSFSLDADTDPPTIVGISPEPDGHTNNLRPIVAFRCTDPSGIDERSLQVTFTVRAGRPPRPKDFTIIRKGVYQVSMSKLGITKGTLARHAIVRFQPSKPLHPGKCRVRVVVTDSRGNKLSKDWSFECTQ